MKRKFIKIAFGSLLIAAFSYALINEGQRQFRTNGIVKNIKKSLPEVNVPVKATDIFEGNWTKICFKESSSLGVRIPPEVLGERFDVSHEELLFPYGILSASDFNWVLILFYPPRTVKMYEIPNKDLLSFGVQIKSKNEQLPSCRGRDEAYLVMSERELSWHPPYQGVLMVTDLKYY